MGGRYCAINSPLGPRWGQKSLDLRSRDFCPHLEPRGELIAQYRPPMSFRYNILSMLNIIVDKWNCKIVMWICLNIRAYLWAIVFKELWYFGNLYRNQQIRSKSETRMRKMISSPATPTVCLERNVIIFQVATWHYWCRHNLKIYCFFR